MKEREFQKISRQEIQENGERIQEELQESGERLTVVAEDAEIVQDTLDSLAGEETSEALEAIQKSITDAEETAGTEFDREDEELQQVQQEGTERESNLDTQSRSVEEDLNRISEACGHIHTEEVAKELNGAETGAQEEIDFLQAEIQRSREVIAESKQVQQEQANRLQAARRTGS